MQDRPARFTALDAVLLAALLCGAALLAWRATAAQDYTWRWHVLAQYLVRLDEATGRWVPGLLAQGLATTVRLSLWTMLLATLLGGGMGLARASGSLFWRLTGGVYVGLVRNVPPLVLVFIFYFFLSDMLLRALGIEAAVRALPGWAAGALAWVMAPADQLPNFLAALMTMAVYEGAYIAEHVRAGIQSVERGQREAARALGFSPWQQMRLVILPQAVARIVPPLAGQFIATIKDTAIVSVISVQELTFQGLELMAATYMTYEIMIAITLLYLLLTLACSALARRLELHLRRA
ncbi:amino acid ABC transporter permease [Desulfocurvus sp.]|jgi:polar amino acid transport system permease protein|uniref:amino acid ABC transporter permease n=1 Tax=Desulfocurvus sp. TaxID=2871698 RepID=UPI0025BE868B|nr:amino acid ABC transporter permease [Desulfocurvus sp.]MCK9240594.1 amino acid ABC transporter permease [Desulfocurvus sp.]